MRGGFRLNRPNCRQFYNFPIKSVRVNGRGEIEALAEAPMAARVAGRPVTIRAGKMDEWFRIPVDWLRRKYRLSDTRMLLSRLEREIEFAPAEVRAPLPDLEAVSAPMGADPKWKRRLRKMAKDTWKISGRLEEEPDDGFSYAATRKGVTLALLSAENDRGDRLFESIRSFETKHDSEEFTVVAKMNQKAFKARGNGIPREEAVIKLIEDIERATVAVKTDKVAGAIGVSKILNVEEQD